VFALQAAARNTSRGGNTGDDMRRSLNAHVNASNDSRLQHLFSATISKDSTDTKQYLSKAWNGMVPIQGLYRQDEFLII